MLAVVCFIWSLNMYNCPQCGEWGYAPSKTQPIQKAEFHRWCHWDEEQAYLPQAWILALGSCLVYDCKMSVWDWHTWVNWKISLFISAALTISTEDMQYLWKYIIKWWMKSMHTVIISSSTQTQYINVPQKVESLIVEGWWAWCRGSQSLISMRDGLLRWGSIKTRKALIFVKTAISNHKYGKLLPEYIPAWKGVCNNLSLK